jgi:hypothetical protein
VINVLVGDVGAGVDDGAMLSLCISRIVRMCHRTSGL